MTEVVQVTKILWIFLEYSDIFCANDLGAEESLVKHVRFTMTLGVMLFVAPAHAQDGLFSIQMNAVQNQSLMSNIIHVGGLVRDEQLNDDENQGDRDLKSNSLLTYEVSQSRRQANQKRFLSAIPGGAELAQSDLIGQVDQAIRPMGLRADNVADAYAVWWVSAWEAVNRQDAADSPTLYAAVKGQATRALVGTPQFAGINDAQKQEMAESMLIQAAMIDAYIEGTAGNPAQQAELASAVNQGAKAMGLDLTTMVLTEQGFSPRKR